MPRFDEITKFMNFKNQIEHPYIIYMDFEALLKMLKRKDLEKNTYKIHKHFPYQFTIYLVSRVDREFNIPFIFTIKDEQDLDNINYKLIEEFDKISKYISERYVQAEYNNIFKLTEEE